MRTIIVALSTVLLAALLIPAAAQRGRGNRRAVAGSGKPAVPVEKLRVTLGHSELTGGTVRKVHFDSFAKQGLVPSAGKVADFFFVYAERNLYEDSVGNPIVVTELMTETSYGPKLSKGISETIYDRTKPGDTAWFENIRITMPNGTTAYGENMKFIIAR